MTNLHETGQAALSITDQASLEYFAASLSFGARHELLRRVIGFVRNAHAREDAFAEALEDARLLLTDEDLGPKDRCENARLRIEYALSALKSTEAK